MVHKFFKNLFRIKGQRKEENSERLYRNYEEQPAEFRLNVNSMFGCLFFLALIMIINILIFLVYRIY